MVANAWLIDNYTIQEPRMNSGKHETGGDVMPIVYGGVAGAGIGGGVTLAALYGLGKLGLSAVGITSALAAAGKLLGGGMVEGVFVLAAPIVAGGSIGGCAAMDYRHKQHLEEKDRMHEKELAEKKALIKSYEETLGTKKE